jgi:uncharacterized protein (DUF1800 family)
MTGAMAASRKTAKKKTAKKRVVRCAPKKVAKKRKHPKGKAAEARLSKVRRRSARKKAAARKCLPVKKHVKAPVPAPLPPGAPNGAGATAPGPATPSASPAVTPVPDPPVPPPDQPIESPLPRFQGTFGVRQAERLLWRAGFGPRPGESERIAAMGLDEAVKSFTRPTGTAVMEGPEPTGRDGGPLSPADVFTHDHLYWMDRMLRSSHQLVERMALILHDWFATSSLAGISTGLMLDQTNVFRAHGLGSFRDLVHDVTSDPAMILFLNLNRSHKTSVNENYARELMELFTLGADRGAYTEQDVRELARALTGWVAEDSAGVWTRFWFNPARHDDTPKTIFGKTANFGWEDAVQLVVDHPMHASFFVKKLWSYFIPVPPSDAQRQALEELYVSTGNQIRPVLEAILTSQAFYDSPRMVKPPVVFVTGAMRILQRFIHGEAWDDNCLKSGQRLYWPPDVGGWDDTRWLDTCTMQGRWATVYFLLRPHLTVWNTYDASETADQAVDAALKFWGDPPITGASRTVLLDYASSSVGAAPDSAACAQRQNALRQLIGSSPEYQTS